MKHLTGELEPTPRRIARKKNNDIVEIIDVYTGEVKSGRKDTILRSNAIGSCVVIVAYDTVNKIGALAHVMVPGAAPARKLTQRTRYAVDAIEELVNKMADLGVEKSNIETCLVGGGNVLEKENDSICEANISSVTDILKRKKCIIRAKAVRGVKRRTVSLFIKTGSVRYSEGDEKEELLWTFNNS